MNVKFRREGSYFYLSGDSQRIHTNATCECGKAASVVAVMLVAPPCGGGKFEKGDNKSVGSLLLCSDCAAIMAEDEADYILHGNYDHAGSGYMSITEALEMAPYLVNPKQRGGVEKGFLSEKWRVVVDWIRDNPNAKAKDIALSTGVGGHYIASHLSRLVRIGFISYRYEGSKRVYYVEQ